MATLVNTGIAGHAGAVAPEPRALHLSGVRRSATSDLPTSAVVPNKSIQIGIASRPPSARIQGSRTTAPGFLSARMATNVEWRR